jgi:hypothetical protein
VAQPREALSELEGLPSEEHAEADAPAQAQEVPAQEVMVS